MDINKALGIAKSLKNHFRAFEELDAFLNEVVALVNLQKEFESRKADLQEEINVLEEEKTKVGVATKKFKGEKKKQIDTLTRELEGSLEERKKDLSTEIEELEVKKDKLSDELFTMEKTHDKNLNRIRKETVDAEEVLKSAERKIQNIKSKLE